MADVASDIRAAMGDFGETVILPGGRIVQALASVASSDDALNGDSIFPGRTRTLRFESGDAGTLETGQNLTWSGKVWRVNHLHLLAAGRITTAFLGAP